VARAPISPPPPQQAAPAPDFALAPEQNYLAKALDSRRKGRLRHAAAAPSSAVEAAQMEYLRQLSEEIITKIAWEVVPELAEVLLREQIAKRDA
jgi:hypothetical protein